jgi:PRC-barrel domain
MLKKYIATGLAGSLLLASAALAQTPTAKTDRTDAAPAAAESSAQLHGDWRASKVAGLNVYNDSNENVGTINDLLMDKSGSIKAPDVVEPPAQRLSQRRWQGLRRSPKSLRIARRTTRPLAGRPNANLSLR